MASKRGQKKCLQKVGLVPTLLFMGMVYLMASER